MFNKNYYIIIALGLLILIYFIYNNSRGSGNTEVTQSGGGHFRPFSYLNQDISQGLKGVSYSNIQNPIKYTDQWYDNCDKPSYVYFGTPNPMVHEMKPMAVPKDTMFYFANAKFSPECCQGGAPYSTSSGCVCAFPKQIYTKCPYQKPYECPIGGPNSWQLDN